MRRQHSAILTVLLATLCCVPGALAEDPDAPKAPPDVSKCAKVTASARYEAYGYTHVIELKNGCDKPVECSVWTNVDPDKLTLRAKPGESASVVTRKGSPSRDVTAGSECKTGS